MNDEELTSHFENVDQQLETIDRRFDAVDQRFEHMEAFVREEGAATRRHMDVIADGLRAEIKLFAEGHTALVTSLATLASRHERTERRVDRVEDGQIDHEHRLRKLEEPDRA